MLMDSGADGNFMDTELVSQLHLNSVPIQNPLEALAITCAPLVHITRHPSEREAMNKYIQESLAAGIIRPSSSPAGAGFFFVGKEDGGLRPCIDYRGINAITAEASEEPAERDTILPSHCWVVAALWDIEALVQSARWKAVATVQLQNTCAHVSSSLVRPLGHCADLEVPALYNLALTGNLPRAHSQFRSRALFDRPLVLRVRHSTFTLPILLSTLSVTFPTKAPYILRWSSKHSFVTMPLWARRKSNGLL
ncbi:hypothetical protein SKAU_G00387090 [Synaphobranchus kaupii]|uniref:Uncharacterized protein n=1 Tax=Synaphobranchus kaupii TaxID=118154 RepID=A0A9Q1EAR6_SYNKA|nr:hypothetical protein SKAU_G00387090 [Synaphobranchus kaupii]